MQVELISLIGCPQSFFFGMAVGALAWKTVAEVYSTLVGRIDGDEDESEE